MKIKCMLLFLACFACSEGGKSSSREANPTQIKDFGVFQVTEAARTKSAVGKSYSVSIEGAVVGTFLKMDGLNVKVAGERFPGKTQIDPISLSEGIFSEEYVHWARQAQEYSSGPTSSRVHERLAVLSEVSPTGRILGSWTLANAWVSGIEITGVFGEQSNDKKKRKKYRGKSSIVTINIYSSSGD
eukprot:TRINITY_DN89_c3_g3_i1.p1 TRINITY_DN89_c3_g3~~TRINITY_DN89_c3_g3_i1.p1  ORF type:complete len:201 (+),score=32.41 TRINITY_DN89_c3_g3_i1:48-605(+)